MSRALPGFLSLAPPVGDPEADAAGATRIWKGLDSYARCGILMMSETLIVGFTRRPSRASLRHSLWRGGRRLVRSGLRSVGPQDRDDCL